MIEDSYLINLIYAYMNGVEPEKVNENISWKRLHDRAQFHGVLNMLYYILGHFKIPVDADVGNLLRLENSDYIGVEAIQELEIQNLLSIFEEEGIDAMPLKGYVLKHMYPLVDMREMCDIDVLIKEENYPRISEIMKENGFTFDKETPHEYIFKKDEMINIEFHKDVVPDYNKKLHSYYGSGWELAKKADGYNHVYEMKIEDFYVYTLVHAAKHYLDSGIGIRQVLDLWIIEKKNPDMDFEYIDAQLLSLDLSRFKENITGLMKKWFDNETVNNPVISEMEDYIINSGVRGKGRTEKISDIYRSQVQGSEDGYKKVVLSALFPSVKMLSLGYPVLRKCALLYPFCWVHRLVYNLLFERKKLREKYARDGIEAEEINEFARHCNAVGISGDM